MIALVTPIERRALGFYTEFGLGIANLPIFTRSIGTRGNASAIHITQEAVAGVIRRTLLNARMRRKLTDLGARALIDFGTLTLLAKGILTVTILSFTTRARRTHRNTLSIGDIADIGAIEAIFIATRPRRTFADDTEPTTVTRIPAGTAVEVARFDAFSYRCVARTVIRASIRCFAFIDAFSAIAVFRVSADIIILA